MTFTLTFDTDNAAFDGDDRRSEVSRILQDVARKVADGRTEGKAMDSNGNSVGVWQLETTPEYANIWGANAELVRKLAAATGGNAEAASTGGNCTAIYVTDVPRRRGRRLLITDGDAQMPLDRDGKMSWGCSVLDEDADDTGDYEVVWEFGAVNDTDPDVVIEELLDACKHWAETGPDNDQDGEWFVTNQDDTETYAGPFDSEGAATTKASEIEAADWGPASVVIRLREKA